MLPVHLLLVEPLLLLEHLPLLEQLLRLLVECAYSPSSQPRAV